MRERAADFPLVLLCFLLSGFSALLYETAWTREFAFVFGTSDLAVAAVLAAYMGGLAAGAAAAARIAPRLRRPVLVYGALELGIALCALAVPFGMHALNALYVAALGGGETAGEPGGLATGFRLATAFLLLLPPTALMGATLPLLARHAVRRDEQVGPRVGALYATNTAGAIAGTLCAAFLLLPAFGLRHTVYAGAAVNALVFLGAAWLARSAPPPPATTTAERAEPTRSPWILPAILLSGAVSFVYEVTWVRLLSQLLGGSVYAFSTMLGSFLLGIALGSAAAGRIARSSGRALAGFAWAQIGIALLVLFAFAAADRLPALARALGAGAQADLAANALLAGAVLLPFAVCIGATFPFAVRLVAPDPEGSARATARVYAWNTVGAIAGAIGAGFVLLPTLGFRDTVLLGATANVALGLASALATRPLARAPLLAALAMVALLALRPVDEPWQLLRSSPFTPEPSEAPLDFYAVGRSSTVMVLDRGSDWQITTNGLPESMVPRVGAMPGRFVEARWLGFLPLLLRPDVERALVIGLGGGIAVEGVPRTVSRIDVVELEPQVVEANRFMSSGREIDPLTKPGVRVVVNDARGALMLSDTRYDAVVSQPSHPWTAGASHLYTREFFALVRDHMQPDGVFVQWIGIRFVDEALLRTLVATLVDVFPHVQVFQPVPLAVLFAASAQPLDLEAGAAGALATPAALDLARYGIDQPEDALAALVLDDDGARAFARGAVVNTDDHNLLASRSARLARRAALVPASLAKLLAPHDPLPALAAQTRVSALPLVRRLAAQRSVERAERVAAALDEPEREVARGWIERERGRPQRAAQHFERALALVPDHAEAQAGLLLLGSGPRPGDGTPGPDPRTEALARALPLLAANDLDALRALDAELAAVGTGSPLFDPATRARARWRLATQDPERAREGLALLDHVIARGAVPDDYLLRAELARVAQRPEAAWAAIEQLAQVLRPGGRSRGIARQARGIAQELPDKPGARALRARLARLAQ